MQTCKVNLRISDRVHFKRIGWKCVKLEWKYGYAWPILATIGLRLI